MEISGGTTFSCAAASCEVGDKITLKLKACDSDNACAEKTSNDAYVIRKGAGAGTVDPTYMVLAIMVAFLLLAFAYMMTYALEMI